MVQLADMEDFATQRTHWVDSQVRPNDVTDHRLIDALSAVKREDFVPPGKRAVAYAEGCVPLNGGRAILDARTFSKMLQLAAIKPTDLVLDVGAATGYSTAVLARLARQVIALEEDPSLETGAVRALSDLPNVKVLRRPLKDGLAGDTLFDVIVVNGATETQPDALLAQLAEGGRLVCVVREAGVGRATLYVRGGSAYSARPAFDSQAPVLPGFSKVAGFVF